MIQEDTIHKQQFLDLHLRVLKGLIEGMSFDQLRELFEQEMSELSYLKVAEGPLLTFYEDELVAAYPISPHETPYRVKVGTKTTGYAMCAIDALGVPYTFMQQTTLFSVFADTGEEFSVTIDPTNDIYKTGSNTREIFVSYTSPDQVSNIALQQCPTINFYSSKEKIPSDLESLSFDDALVHAKQQFSQESLLACVKKFRKNIDQPSTSINCQEPKSCCNC